MIRIKKYMSLLIIIPLVSNAQVPDSLIFGIDEVIVRENRISVSNASKPAPIIIMGSKEIENLPVSDFTELLHFNAGIDIRTRGINGIQNDVSIRGSSFDQVLVLINGIKINDPQTGHHTLNLPIDLTSIDRIEIHKGSSARVFGQNAFAGAINIITSVPTRNGAYIKLDGGEYGSYGAGAGITFGNIDYRSTLSINYNSSDGYKYNTDYRMSNVFYQSDILSSAGILGIIAGLSSRSFGANGFYASPDYSDQYERVNTYLASVSFRPSVEALPIEIISRLYWRLNKDDYIFIRHDPGYYRNQHSSKVAGFDINMTYKSSLGITGFGFDFTSSGISSNRLGEHRQLDAITFLDHRFEFSGGRIIISPGVQWIIKSDFANRLLPGMDFGIKISDDFMAYLNSGYTYRVPSYTDLYYEDPVNSGNPELKPEYALSNEIGIKSSRTRGISFMAGVFNRIGTDMIDRVKENVEDKWMPVNINTVIYNGAEFSFDISPAIFFTANSSFFKTFNISYTHINSYVQGELPQFSRWEFENLKDQLSASITFSYTNRLSQTISYRYYNRVNMNDYSLIDTRLTWERARLNLFIDISNISNTEYKETNLVTMPGRWFSAGINYNLKFHSGQLL